MAQHSPAINIQALKNWSGMKIQLLTELGEERKSADAHHGHPWRRHRTQKLSEIRNEVSKNYSLYLFEGLKSSGNKDLHITSTRFDEPRRRSQLLKPRSMSCRSTAITVKTAILK